MFTDIINLVQRIRGHFADGLASLLVVKYILTNVWAVEEAGPEDQMLHETGFMEFISSTVFTLGSIFQKLLVTFSPVSFSGEALKIGWFFVAFTILLVLGGILSPKHFWDYSGPVRKDLGSLFAKIAAVFVACGLLLGVFFALFALLSMFTGLLCLVGALEPPDFHTMLWTAIYLGILGFAMVMIARIFFVVTVLLNPNYFSGSGLHLAMQVSDGGAESDMKMAAKASDILPDIFGISTNFKKMFSFFFEAFLPFINFVVSGIIILLEIGGILLLVYLGTLLYTGQDYNQALDMTKTCYDFFLSQLH